MSNDTVVRVKRMRDESDVISPGGEDLMAWIRRGVDAQIPFCANNRSRDPACEPFG